MTVKKLYKIAFMGDKDHGCDIISTLESWGGSNHYSRIGSDPEYVYFINVLGMIDVIHNSQMLSEEMKNFYFMFWHDYNIECHLKVGESINYGGQDYDVDSILFDANNRCIVYKLKSFGIGVEYITNNELTPTEEYQTEEENNEYLCKNNIKRKLAIRGHATRGNEVIEILEMMGGKNNCDSPADNLGLCYLIDDEFDICAHYFGYDDYEDDELNIFTLEEFLEKYPFKIGDKVFDKVDGDPGIITAMKWDEDVSDMKYRVVFDNGDMGWYTNDTIELLNLEEGKTMNKKLAIKGHPTRGKEIIELLEMMGGKNNYGYDGEMKSLYFTIYNDIIIYGNEKVFLYDNYVFFTLEEFLEKFPFKVGDKVFLYDNITEGCVTGMKWDEDKGTVKYCVYTSAECWCDVEELLKWNAIDLVEKHYEEQCKEMNEIETKRDMDKVVDNLEKISVKNHKMGPKSKLPSKYYEDKLEEIQRKRDMDKKMFMLGHTLVPDKVDGNLEYNIINGYEFDRVENGKIILKPIKPKYPKTYKECCDVLLIPPYYNLRYHTYEHNYGEFATSNNLLSLQDILNTLGKLIICRNAYWKIAGEQMGLGKPWEPDWENLSTNHEFIKIDKGCCTCSSRILVFPTEEMRDVFYKNFKDLIEQCKELL